MARLHIVIARASRTAAPEVLYCGDDGVAALRARDTSPLSFVEYFRNPRGIRKEVPGAAANAAAKDAAFQAETDLAQAEYNAAVLAKAEELVAPFRDAAALANGFEADLAKLRAESAAVQKGLEAALTERDAENKSLREELKKAKKAAGAPPPPEPTGP